MYILHSLQGIEIYKWDIPLQYVVHYVALIMVVAYGLPGMIAIEPSQMHIAKGQCALHQTTYAHILFSYIDIEPSTCIRLGSLVSVL